MLLYFDFEDKRRKADVVWPIGDEAIVVHIADNGLTGNFPNDLYFRIDDKGKVWFDIEDKANLRLLDLQNCLRRRIQELYY